MAKKRISFSLAALIIFFVVLLSLIGIRVTGLGSSFPNPVGNLLREILAPLQSGVMSASDAIKDKATSIWQSGQLKRENDTFRSQIDQLTNENNQLKQKILAGMRFEELEKKFDSPAIWKSHIVGASVINREPSNWYRSIVINRGSRDGVKLNDPIITNVGLVGKVISVSPNTAEAILILNPDGQVSGTIRQSQGSASFGIVQGDSKRGLAGSGGTLSMTIPKDDKVNSGDFVLTSGMGGVYPKDIPIGTVTEVTLESGGLLKTAKIVPLVQFDRLEEVFIVLSGGTP